MVMCLYGPADATATHCLLLQIGFTFLVPDEGPLNGCVYMYVCVCLYVVVDKGSLNRLLYV